jgi:hypothetical protein
MEEPGQASGSRRDQPVLWGDELNGRHTLVLYAFQSLVPAGNALQYTTVEKDIVTCLPFWRDVTDLAFQCAGTPGKGRMELTGGISLSLVSGAMTRIFNGWYKFVEV